MDKKGLLIFGGALLVVILDHLIKTIIVATMQLSQTIVLIPYVFSITYVHNFGAGFGILQNQQILLIIISIIVIGLIFYYYKKVVQLMISFQSLMKEKYAGMANVAVLGEKSGVLIFGVKALQLARFIMMEVMSVLV